jgi:hypothetical protein
MISAGAIYIKTRAGMEEVRNRKLKLPSKLRTVLILIDGTKPALILKEEAATLGAPADFLEILVQQGLVEQVGAANVPSSQERRAVVRGVAEPDVKKLDPVARYRTAQQFMNDTAVNSLGLKAFFFTLKLEKCATVDDLRPLVDAYRAAITKGSGEAEAEVLTRRVLELLG